ncbi:MAG TPA: DNA-formamidopyrimidine glycosylase family protein, partial [Longimicrobiales bacterium]|nr:DNA-formamidopyrimidine glycosylase family protein [Longimicrobiales bacterium]
MPELPEAETIVRDLARQVTGRRIESVEVLRPDILAPGTSPSTFSRTLRGRIIEGVSRRGKNVVLELSDLRLVINLGMTGRVVTEDPGKPGPWRHVAVRFELSGGRRLLYDDARRFGRLELMDENGWRQRDSELGIEPLSREFTPARLHELTSRSRTPIRNWLLDQRRVAGVGNIYANEALFRARIRPDRPAS